MSLHRIMEALIEYRLCDDKQNSKPQDDISGKLSSKHGGSRVPVGTSGKSPFYLLSRQTYAGDDC